jgi:putative flippase GtrA
MKMATWLRVAAVLSVLLALGHTAGGLQHWSPPGETEVLRSMGTFRFDALGSNRSYLDFYLGFGYIISLYMFAQGLLLWQLAPLASLPDARVRPMVATFLAVGVGATALDWVLFFTVPTVSNLMISICLAMAWLAGGRENHP